jgi:hypothetical protein
MAARGVPRTTVNGWYRERARTGHPEKAGRIGRTDYWYEDEWTTWHHAYLRGKIDSLTEVDRGGDPDDLVDAAEAARMMRYSSRDVIHGNRRLGYFPEPDAFGSTAKFGWYLDYDGVLDGAWRDYLTLETAASRISVSEAQRIPGLLQTPAYAQALADTDPALKDDAARRSAVEAVVARQRAVLREGGLQQCRPSRPPTAPRSSSRTGAPASRSSSVTDGPCRPTTGTPRCFSSSTTVTG